MATRLVINGREVYRSQDARKRDRLFDIAAVARHDEQFGPGQFAPNDCPCGCGGSIIHDVPVPIPADSPQSPFREGALFFDPDDNMHFRVMRRERMRPEDGWMSTDFWLDHWRGARYEDLLQMCRDGLLVPGMFIGSGVKRFMCPDERRALGFKVKSHYRNVETLGQEFSARVRSARETDRTRRKIEENRFTFGRRRP
jgi:hypothetical protein